MLDKILEYKRLETARAREELPLHRLEEICKGLPFTRDFAGALRRGASISLLAEIKKASPSRGVLCPDFDPVMLAGLYTRAGAAALSVLTDERFFHGHPRHIALVKEATPLPLLRKDFIIDEYQIFASRALGADALLLIVAALEEARLREYLALASRLGLAALVETHTPGEIETALRAGVQIIGINNRDLHTFKTDIRTTLELRPLIPPGRLVVSESGIRSRRDVVLLARAGVDAVLVGEALVTSADVEAKIRELFGQPAKGDR
ncbi:MAG TPA: indole-3-glycerol phosphate synthase TrpC [Peptococcaceae bacterium]|nr:MAG: Indole-3-glycerol phosphate synthase [Moorella sp. 60_41]HBT47073.1 indole-3-glycerol phosphate synthase TrpC [Peptococcaceae bacterium]